VIKPLRAEGRAAVSSMSYEFMTSLLKNKPSALLLAGTGLALLAAALGWQVARPTAEKVALSELRPPDAPAFSKGQPTVAGASKKQSDSKPFLPNPFPQAAPQSATASTPAPALPPRPQPAPPFSKAAVEQLTAVDSALPGNFLVANGQRVSIQQVVTGGTTGGRALDVAITPVADAAKTSASGQGESDMAPNQTGGTRAGFTYEQQLFRSKWGWAAYDAANRAATWDLQKSAPATQ
jgi:biotin carboxyl carrier protein